MSITDELREWVRDGKGSLLAIADRIDAEHERQLGVLYRDMSDAEWVRLPKDADDVPWKVGDRDEDGNVVTQLRLSSDGWYAITDGPSAYHPEQHRHYHAPTVEDVLREFASDIADVLGGDDFRLDDSDELFTEYAKRLTLASNEE